MKKSRVTKSEESKPITRSSSRIKQKINNNIKQTSKASTKSTTKSAGTSKSGRVTRATSDTAKKRLSVLATKIRQQKSKNLANTSKTKHDQETTTVKNNRKTKGTFVKVNEKKQTKKVTTVSTPVTRKSAQTSQENNKSDKKNDTKPTNVIPKKSTDSQIPNKENYTPRKERLTQRLKKLNSKNGAKNKLSTPVNKKIDSPKKNSIVHTRVLRNRKNIVPNKYKDFSLLSPVKKSDEPKSPNPLDVYNFEIDSAEEQKQSDSSGEEDNSMKVVLKKIRKAQKKPPAKKQKKTIKKKPDVNEPKKEDNANDGNKNKLNETKKKSINIELNKSMEILKSNFQLRELSINLQPINIPSLSVNEVEMVTISDHSDPINHSVIDPSIQARNIVAEVTKSFIEDLSDEESSVKSPGKMKIISNVVIRNAAADKNKKIFNSTLNELKPSKPWRIDVSVIRRKPQYFTYKDKSFTPRYEPELEPITLPKEIERNANIENIKPMHQTSILDFVNSSKPKIIQNKVHELFVEPPKNNIQSPRKVLGEINFVQSTPMKPNTQTGFKSPNVSAISPKKRTDDMFEFSYYSDDENKENIRRSPRKIIKSVKQIQETVKQSELQQNIDKENVSEIEIVNDMDDITVPLFQDIEEPLNVSKKSTKKYVRKNPKRKRLPSVDTIPSDDECEPEVPEKKKPKKGRTKQEDLEADRLASHYNSMFEEIEKHPLVIE